MATGVGPVGGTSGLDGPQRWAGRGVRGPEGLDGVAAAARFSSDGPSKGVAKGRGGARRKPESARGAHDSPWRRARPLPRPAEPRTWVSVRTRVWVRGCHVGPRAGAAGPRGVRRPGSTSAELSALRAGGRRSESSGGREGRSRGSVLPSGSSPLPSPPPPPGSQPWARGEPTPSWRRRPRPPPPFLRHKVYLQQKGARIEQPRGREQELEREREGRAAGGPAGGRGAAEGDPDRAGPRAMPRVAPAEVGAGPGARR